MIFSNKKTHNYNKGILAEFLVIIILFFKGYRILKHNYRNKITEIDIIAKKGKMIVFIEVKKRKCVNDAIIALKKTQMTKIKKAALIYLGKKDYNSIFNIRFDLFAIGGFFKLKHLKNYW